EEVSVCIGGDDPQVDGDAVVGRDPAAALAGGSLGGGERMVEEGLGQHGRLAGGGDQVDVVAGFGAPSSRTGHLDSVARGMGAEGSSPVPSRLTIFCSGVLPLPGSSVARPARASSSTDTGLWRTTRAASRYARTRYLIAPSSSYRVASSERASAISAFRIASGIASCDGERRSRVARDPHL